MKTGKLIFIVVGVVVLFVFVCIDLWVSPDFGAFCKAALARSHTQENVAAGAECGPWVGDYLKVLASRAFAAPSTIIISSLVIISGLVLPPIALGYIYDDIERILAKRRSGSAKN